MLTHLRETLKRFKQYSHRISGVLIMDFDPKNRTSLTFLSPEKSCPNVLFDLMVNDSTYGYCRQQQWNSPYSSGPYSEGLMFEDWPFPIFFIKNQTNIDEIKDVSSVSYNFLNIETIDK